MMAKVGHRRSSSLERERESRGELESEGRRCGERWGCCPAFTGCRGGVARVAASG
jgi:hypothetical protein